MKWHPKRLMLLFLESYKGIPQIIWILSGLLLINRCGNMVIPFVGVYLTQKLGFSLSVAGIVMSCYGFGAVAGNSLGGYLTDRIGFNKVQVISLLATGILYFFLLRADTAWMFGLCYFLVSLAAESFRPANSVAVAKYTQPHNLTRSLSLNRIAFNIGWTIAPAVGGIIATYSYSGLFVVNGLTSLLAAIAFFYIFFVRYPVSFERFVKKASEKWQVYRDRSFLAFFLLCTVYAVVFMQIVWTTPVFFKNNLHFNEATIGFLMALNGLLVVVFEMPLVYQFEKRYNKIHLIIAGVFLSVLSYLAFVVLPAGLFMALVSILLITFSEIFAMPFMSNLAISRGTERTRGQYTALYAMTFSVANIITPLICTRIADHLGFTWLWIFVCCLGLATMAGYWVVEPYMTGRRVPKEEA